MKKRRKKGRRKKKIRISRRAFCKLRRQRRYRLGADLFGALFLCLLLFIFSYYALQRRTEGLYQSLRREQSHLLWICPDLIETREPEKKKEEPKGESELAPSLRREKRIDFSKLEELNPDIYAWIEIPGTLVDYPVLQHPTDDAYYLNHTLERALGLPGSIYSEKRHPKDFSAVQTVLYGHNMKNDTMFGSLHDYEKEGKLKESPYVYIYLPEKTLVYEIFAAVRFSDVYLPEYCDCEREEEFNQFVEELRQAPGQVNQELEVTFGSRLLTLSTCIGNDPEHRFLVEAVYLGAYESGAVTQGKEENVSTFADDNY